MNQKDTTVDLKFSTGILKMHKKRDPTGVRTLGIITNGVVKTSRERRERREPGAQSREERREAKNEAPEPQQRGEYPRAR